MNKKVISNIIKSTLLASLVLGGLGAASQANASSKTATHEAKQIKRGHLNHRLVAVRRGVKPAKAKRVIYRKPAKKLNRRFYAGRYYYRTWKRAQRINVRALRFDHHQLGKLYQAYNEKGVTRAGRRALRYHIKSLKSTMRSVNGHLKIDDYKLSLVR